MNLQTSSDPGPNGTLSLLALDDDILSLITLLLLVRERSHNRVSISLVCKRLRAISLTFLFRVVRWPREGRIEFYPRGLWKYMRHLYYLQVQWRSHHLRSLETLSDVLPHLQNLTTFSYSDQKFGPTLKFIESLTRSPLANFELSTTFFSHKALTYFTKFSGIQRLIVKQQGVALAIAPESKQSLSLQCAANLTFACYETLSHIELPGEFFSFQAFVSRHVKMSALKTLILHSYPPLNAQEHPIWKISPTFPVLSKLEILYKLRVTGAHPSRYALMPTDLPPGQKELCIFPPLLDTLSIANPMMEDRIFLHLPPFLTNLNLDFIPEWENMLSSKDILAYHKPERMRSFLNHMKWKAHGSLPNLKVLCIKMGWCATPDIIMCIGRLFPDLAYLEFQGLRYVDRTEEPHPDMDGSVSSLASLQSLQTLKLAVELPEDPYEYSAAAERDVGSVEQAASKWAEALALQLPQLRLLAFERRPHIGRSLGPRVLQGHSDWTWFDINKGIAQKQVPLPDGPLEWDLIQKRRAEAETRYRHHL
ncbi:hypothetical protein E4T56_gene13007 [Termitomyces sp. T112]|nr:hypothetical protein E4T56_gene13007 [Termitomyces sp. T112]